MFETEGGQEIPSTPLKILPPLRMDPSPDGLVPVPSYGLFADNLKENNDASSMSSSLFYSLRHLLYQMTSSENGTCLYNCSGRGECLEGTCHCQVQYNGDSCTDPNVLYFASFACIFYLIAGVSLIQLFICIQSEYRRMKTPNLRAACKITTQKALYVITCIAATLRGAYFSSPSHADVRLSSSFVSAFYPMILTGGSLIVCFWAEAFHLRDIRCELPRFLGKSFFGFITFNAITYSLFLAEVILMQDTNTLEEKSFFAHIFNGCYAVLMFIMVVFFLIYGVEVYFKVRGGFVGDTVIVEQVHSRRHTNTTEVETVSEMNPSISVGYSPIKSENVGNIAPEGPDVRKDVKKEECRGLVDHGEEDVDDDGEMQGACTETISQRGVNVSQLHQSRFGLVFQACMLMITVCFLFSDVLGGFWKSKVPLMSRNAYDVIFRIVELAVALWFPCVLWNCISPEQLWILNPKKILKKFDFEKTLEIQRYDLQGRSTERRDSLRIGGDAISVNGECWICYDSDALDCGPLITPCDCKGDMSVVHHNCLRKWLMECAEQTSLAPSTDLMCRVCNVPYQLERKKVWWIGGGFTARHWFRTATIITVLCLTTAITWATMQLMTNTFFKALTAGVTLLIFYICLRLLGFNTFTAYQRARISAVKIIGGFGGSPPTSEAANTNISHLPQVSQLPPMSPTPITVLELPTSKETHFFPQKEVSIPELPNILTQTYSPPPISTYLPQSQV